MDKGKVCILVIEDDDALRDLTVQVLQGDGFPHVSTAADGQTAIDMMAQGQTVPHVIVTDYDMPRRNGLEVVAWVVEYYKKPQHPAVKILFTSSDVDVGRRPLKEMAIGAGADEFLAKPVSIRGLRAAVTRLVEQIP